MLHDYYLKILTSGSLPCDSLVCTSRAAQTALSNILQYVAEQFNGEFGAHLQYRGRIDRIPLCVDTEVLRPREKVDVRERLALPKGAFVVLFLGYLSLVKADLIPLLRVWKSLVADNPSRRLVLVIAGTGEPWYVSRLRSDVRSLDLARRVRFMLDVDDATKELLFSAADVFVSPADSVEESFGLAPVEAMSCGVPPVISDWNGYRDTVIHGETGFLVPTRWTECDDLRGAGSLLGWSFDHTRVGQSVSVDLVALKRSIQALVGNEDLRRRMGESSRLRAELYFSMRAVAKQYEELWTELSSVARSSPAVEPRSSYAEAAYFKFFGHFSSVELEGHSLLALTDFGRRVVEGQEPIPLCPQLTNAGLLEEALLIYTLLEVAASERNSSGSRAPAHPVFGEVLGSLEKAGHPGRMKRHMMWLIKHGLVDVRG